MRPHGSPVPLATLLSLNLGCECDERIFVAMSIWHSVPLNMCTSPVLLMGGTAVLQRESHPIESLQMIVKERINNLSGHHSTEKLDEFVRNGADAAFLPPEEKAALRSALAKKE